MAAGAYDVGKAFLDVIPSFDGAQLAINRWVSRLRPIDIPVNLDPKTVGTQLDKAVTQAAKGTTVDLGSAKLDLSKVSKDLSGVGKGLKVDVPVDADTRLLDAKEREIVARNIAVLAKIDGDLTALRDKLAKLSTETPEIGVNVDLQKTALDTQIAALEARKLRVQLQIDSNAAATQARLAALDAEASRLDGKTATLNVESSSASRAIGILSLLTAGIAAAGYAAPAAAAAIATIPAAISVLGQGIGTLLLAFNGVGDAVTAMQTADDNAATTASSNARARVSAANQIASAQSALHSAQVRADRASITGAQQVQAARQGLGRAQEAAATAQESALRRTEDSERSYADAVAASRDAQAALNGERADAVDRLEELSISLRGSALDEESATLALEKAQARLAKLQSAGVTGPDLREADLAARQAAQSLLEVQHRYADLRAQADRAAVSGVEGDEQVIAAHRRADEAAARVAAAERDLTQVRRDGARQVAQAQAQVAQASAAVSQAQQQAAWAQADATQASADAQRQLAAATTAAGQSGAAAMDKLDVALSKLTPEGRAFATFLQREAKPALHQVGDAVQAALLPKLETAFRTLLQLGPGLSTVLSETAEVLGDLAVKGAQMVTSGPWKRDFATIGTRNNQILRALGEAGLSVSDAFRHILVASGPMLLDLAIMGAKAAATFAAFLDGKRASGELSQFFRDMSARLHELWTIVSTVGHAVWDLASALAPFGGGLLRVIEFLAKLITQFSTAHPDLTQLIAGVGLAASAFILFGRAVGGVFGAFSSGRKGITLLTDGLKSVQDKLAATAEGTGRLAGAANTLAHPLASASRAATTLSGAYQDGARRTRVWISAQRDAAGSTSIVGRALDSAAAGVTRFGTSLTTNVVGPVGAVDSAVGRMASRLQGAVSDAVSAASTVLASRFVPATLAVADGADRAVGAVTHVGYVLRSGLLVAAETTRSAVLSLGSALGSALSNPADTASRAMDRVATGIYGTGTALRTGLIRASLEAEAALDTTTRAAERARGVLGRVSDAVQVGFNRVVLEASSVSDRFGTAIQNGIVRSTITANDALGRVGSSLRSGILRPLFDAQAAYRETSTQVREFGATTAALSAPLGQSQTLLDRVKASFTGFTAIAAGAGAGLKSGLSGPLDAVGKGITNLTIAAAGTANALKTGLTNAANGLVGALGGPWGLAITGAVLGLGLLTQSSDAAAQAAEGHRKRVEALASALRDSNGVITEGVRAKAAEALATFEVSDGIRNLLKDARNLGVALPTLTDAYLGNVDAQRQIVDHLRAVQKEHTLTADTGHGVKVSEDEIAFAARQLADIIDSQGGTFQEAVQRNRDLAGATAGSTSAVGALSEEQKKARATTDTLNEKLATIADTSRDVTERGQAIIDFLDALTGKAPSVEQATTKINADIRELAAGFKDANGNIVNFRDGFLDAHGLIDTTTQAGSDLQGVLRGLGADMASAGQSAFDQARALHKSIPEAYQAAVAAMDPYLGRIRDALKQNGFTEEQVARLLASYNLVPPSIATTILLAGDQVASKKVSDIAGQLAALPPSTPVTVDALTGVAEQALIQLGYHIVQLPNGSFAVYSNTDEGQKQADEFVARNQGRPIDMTVALQLTDAEAKLADFKKRNGDMALSPYIAGNGELYYTTSDNRTHVLGKNLAYQADGGVLEFFARGGFSNMSPMSAQVASIVPPNTLRVIGDRPSGDEAFIPIERSPRSVGILAQTASRMGYALMPMAVGGILAMAGGGTLAAASSVPAPAAPSASASASASAEQLTAVTAGMTTLTDVVAGLGQMLAATQATVTEFTATAMVPLADTMTITVTPTLDALSGRLPGVQDGFTVTSGVVTGAMASMTSATSGATGQIGTYLAALRSALQVTGQTFSSTAEWAGTAWARIRGYAADPTRDVLRGPFAALVSAWNFLDASFGLNKPLAPIPIGFADGGPVRGPGTATSDSILARLSTGEFVMPAKITQRVLPFLEALRSGQAEALQAAGYATGGLVADTGSGLNARVLRAQQFAQAQQGKPYIWGGVGPMGFDCSGLMSAITNVITDAPTPYRRLGVAASAPWPGFVRGLNSGFAMGASPVHTAGTLGGINVESTGSHVRFGRDAHGADDRQFPVQSSLPIVGTRFVSGGGAQFDPSALIAAAFADTTGQIAATAARWPGNLMAIDGTAMAGQAVHSLQRAALEQINATSGAAGSGPVVDQVRAIAQRYGWGTGPQWNALDWLVQHESGWNPTAQNPHSTAYGLFQFLDATWGAYGAAKTSNPALQAEAGLKYIKAHYGDPVGAQGFWQQHRWYDAGGWLPPGFTQVANHTGRPEAILTAQQWNSLSTLAGINGGSGGRSITVNARTDASPAHIAHVIDRHLSIGTRL